MKRNIILSSIAIVALTSLIGCGSSSSKDSTITGHLVDSAVSGANYSCGDINGTTDKDGTFTCNSLPVTFSIGSVKLGTITSLPSDGKIYPQDLAGVARGDINNTKVKKLAQLFQSLDKDHNASNGITIDSALASKVKKNITDWEGVDMEAYLYDIDSNIHVVSEDDAIKHLEGQFSRGSNGDNDHSNSDSSHSNHVKVLTVTTPDSVKGYTISSNEAIAGKGKFTTHQTVVTKFECDGSFTNTITTFLSGNKSEKDIDIMTGSDVSVDSDSLNFSGVKSNGENSSSSIPLNSKHQIVAGKTCYYSWGQGSGENCPGNLYVKTITKDKSCNTQSNNTQSKKWYLKYSIDASEPFGPSTMIIKNFKYDCSGTAYDKYGKTCTEVYKDSKDVSLSYSGLIAKDTNLEPMYIFEKGLQLHYVYPKANNSQGFVDINQLGMTEGFNGFLCGGKWKDSYSNNLENGKAFTIKVTGGAGTCKLEFKPCTKELCE